MENIRKSFKKAYFVVLFFNVILFGVVALYGGYIARIVYTEHAPMPSSGGEGFEEIFFNNLKVLAMNFFGFFSMGIYNVYNLFINAISIGEVIGIASLQMSPIRICLKLLPHGLLEAPGLILNFSVGYIPWIMFYVKIKHKDASIKQIINLAIRYVGICLLVGILIVFIAAIIESNVSMRM